MAPDGGEELFQSRLRRKPRTTTSTGSCSRQWTHIGADYGLRVDGGLVSRTGCAPRAPTRRPERP